MGTQRHVHQQQLAPGIEFMQNHKRILGLFCGYRPVAAKLLIGSEIVWGYKNGTNLLCHHGEYGGARISRATKGAKKFNVFCLP